MASGTKNMTHITGVQKLHLEIADLKKKLNTSEARIGELEKENTELRSKCDG